MNNIIDLFCGTGGFSAGFEATGEFQVQAGLDLSGDSLTTFTANHKFSQVIEGDIRQWSPHQVSEKVQLAPGEVEVIIGGPPCQGFSSIRPFRSLNFADPRNTLFEFFVCFVQFYRPEFFVLENVVGLVTHQQGKTIQQISENFENVGYQTDWRILNAVNYGVPQRRERVIMIGRRGLSNTIGFPKPTHFFQGRSMAPLDHPKLIRNHPWLDKHLPPAINVMEAIHDLPELQAGETASYYRNDILPTPFEQERRQDLETLTLHNSTAHSPKMLEVIKHAGSNIFALPKGLVKSGFSTSYSRLEPDKPAVTLTVNFVHPASNKCIHPYQDRALTPREGARLQGFDDNYIFLGTRSQIVKQIGNAVPPLLGRIIAQTLLEQW